MNADRRTFLKATGLVVLAGLAGCTSRAAKRKWHSPQLPNEPNYKGYLDDTSNYHHTVDMRDEDTVTIEVGAAGNMGEYAFEPAAVAVSPNTTVRWEWTGRGGDHNVVAEQGTFTSGEPVGEAGTTFEFAFDRPGVYKYACEPHESMGMKGAIFVALAQPTDFSDE